MVGQQVKPLEKTALPSVVRVQGALKRTLLPVLLLYRLLFSPLEAHGV